MGLNRDLVSPYCFVLNTKMVKSGFSS